jgi:hypothetical protein
MSTMALYVPSAETNELYVVSACGVGASTFQGTKVPIGERISGWTFAHVQVVLNSDATLELGPIARTFGVPLRYAAAVPIVDGSVVAVLVAFSTEPFEKDHRRLLENAATLFVASVALPISDRPARPDLHSEGIQKSRVH